MLLVPLQLGVPGGTEMVVVLLIVVMLFGADRVPKLARSSGQALGEFRRGREESMQDHDDAGDEQSDR